jgi:hypothetical protein
LLSISWESANQIDANFGDDQQAIDRDYQAFWQIDSPPMVPRNSLIDNLFRSQRGNGGGETSRHGDAAFDARVALFTANLAMRENPLLGHLCPSDLRGSHG